jgi:hypothetical protein
MWQGPNLLYQSGLFVENMIIDLLAPFCSHYMELEDRISDSKRPRTPDPFEHLAMPCALERAIGVQVFNYFYHFDNSHFKRYTTLQWSFR